MQQLVVIGAGGFGRETVEAVRAANAGGPTWDVLGFLDDDPELRGTDVEGIAVLGPISRVGDYPDSRVVVCTGHPGNYFAKRRIVQRLDLPEARYATVIHPAAVLSSRCRIGPGSVLLATVVATAAVDIGAHVAVMPGVVFTHDDVVGPYAILGAGARLAGRVRVGQGAYVGAGVLVREDRSIGDWALVGMGSVVTRDIPPGEVWAGVPARFLRNAEVPGDIATARSG